MQEAQKNVEISVHSITWLRILAKARPVNDRSMPLDIKSCAKCSGTTCRQFQSSNKRSLANKIHKGSYDRNRKGNISFVHLRKMVVRHNKQMKHISFG
jgi:hypothetical protein